MNEETANALETDRVIDITTIGRKSGEPPSQRDLVLQHRRLALHHRQARKARLVVLTTEDGIVWSRAPAQQLPARGENVQLFDITRGGPGLVAVGWRREHPGRSDAEIDPVVWTSADGTTWNEAADAEGVFSQPGGQLIAGVTADGPRLVAIGQDGDGRGFNTAVWTSP